MGMGCRADAVPGGSLRADPTLLEVGQVSKKHFSDCLCCGLSKAIWSFTLLGPFKN